MSIEDEAMTQKDTLERLEAATQQYVGAREELLVAAVDAQKLLDVMYPEGEFEIADAPEYYQRLFAAIEAIPNDVFEQAFERPSSEQTT